MDLDLIRLVAIDLRDAFVSPVEQRLLRFLAISLSMMKIIGRDASFA